MQKSLSILSSVNDLFERKLDELNSKYSGKLPFTIINVSTGWFFHIHPYPVYTYTIDFPNAESMQIFAEWALLNGF